jgi:energy-coupling factor transporter ATP-binding protein EcfA2
MSNDGYDKMPPLRGRPGPRRGDRPWQLAGCHVVHEERDKGLLDDYTAEEIADFVLLWGTVVYIKKVTLKDVCCFKGLTLEFNPLKDSGHWAVILGDNGAGKTTVLRSIAMGLCGETSASALLRELYTDWVRYQAVDKTAIIRIEFEAPDRPEPVWIETKITESSSGDTEVHQETSPQDDFPWGDIFVCAYGAKRGGNATESVTEYSSVDSVYTLFKYDAPLQNPELILRRFRDEETAVQIVKTIDSILMLPKGSTRLTRSGITGLGY